MYIEPTAVINLVVIINIACAVDPSMFFSTVDWGQSVKLHQHSWKECLKISKVAKFENDLLKVTRVPPQSGGILKMSVKFCIFVEQYLLCSLWTYQL